jgi:predicted RNase H-like nuclease (RuvC/YqgF family)
MKRFVIVIISLSIFIILIALNYLLWDRENLVAAGESSQANIDALTRINMTLNQEKSRMEQETEKLKAQIEALQGKIEDLETEINKRNVLVDDMRKFIQSIKMKIDVEPIKKVTTDWVTSLREKRYSDAYLSGSANCVYWGNNWSMRMFSDYFEQNVENIQLLFDEEKSRTAIEVIPVKTSDWEMSVYARVQVTLKEGALQDYLKPGKNIIHLVYTYSERVEQWYITSVFSEEIISREEDE